MKRKVKTSLLALMIAIVSITTATIAWFTIADNTRLRGMGMDITSGQSLRFDLDAHEKYEDYVKTLSFEAICGRILKDTGIDFREKSLEPVTTGDCISFRYEDGSEADRLSGDYMEYTLHFIADHDMNVHITSLSGKDDDAGTLIASQNEDLVRSMRIAFVSDEGTVVYDPYLEVESRTEGNVTYFTIPNADKMVYNETNVLFKLKAGEDKPVRVLVWIEGTDEACSNDLKGTDYSISMRFEGTDENFKSFDKSR